MAGEVALTVAESGVQAGAEHAAGGVGVALPRRGTSQAAAIVGRLAAMAERLNMRFRILISLYQILTGLGFVFSIPYPAAYKSLLRVLDLANLDFIDMMPLSCSLPLNFYGTLVLRTLLPLAVLAALYATARASKALASRCSSAGFLLIFLIYPGVSSKVFATFGEIGYARTRAGRCR